MFDRWEAAYGVVECKNESTAPNGRVRNQSFFEADTTIFNPN